MSVTATGKRRRREARVDVRYASRKTGHSGKAQRRAFLAAKAAREGRSFGFNKKGKG
jgi:hypothetical protein